MALHALTSDFNLLLVTMVTFKQSKKKHAVLSILPADRRQQ